MRHLVTKANDLTVITLAVALALVLLVRRLSVDAARASHLRRGYDAIQRRETATNQSRAAGGL
jgi:hypothetical protein